MKNLKLQKESIEIRWFVLRSENKEFLTHAYVLVNN